MIAQSPRFKRRKELTVVICLSILAILIYFNRSTSPVIVVEGFVQKIFSGPKGFFYSLGKKDRDTEISALNKKVRGLEQKMADYQLLKTDNDALRSQFATSGSTSLSLTAAKIIGFQSSGHQPTQFVINAGKKNRLQKGMSVIFEKNLIGKIESVSDSYSVVITPYNTKFQVLAKLTETNANGILIGKSDFLLFDGVVITDQLKTGGIIVTKGEVDEKGVGVVPDLILGKIVSISKRETAPFQSAQIVPLVDYSRLTNIFVISQM